MTILTPNLNLEQPDIQTLTKLGTLPQDWALIINNNLIAIDEHDHTEGTNQIPSTALTISNDIDIKALSITGVLYAGFVAESETNNLSLYTDGLDLWWIDGNGTNIQITKAGAVNYTGDVGGFFGDYVTAKATASLNGGLRLFSFLGANSTDFTTLMMDNLTFNDAYSNVSGTLIIPANVTNTIESLSFVIPVPDFPPFGIITNSTTYEFSNIVGPGTPYSVSRDNVVVSDPDFVLHYNPADQDTFRLNHNQWINVGMGQPPGVYNNNQNYIEVFASTATGVAFLPGIPPLLVPRSSFSFTIVHTITLFNEIPFWNGQFTVQFCKWAIMLDGTEGELPFQYNAVSCRISSVVQKGGPYPLPYTFEVTGSLNNITSESVGYGVYPTILSLLRIAAVYPKFNAQGAYFGGQY